MTYENELRKIVYEETARALQDAGGTGEISTTAPDESPTDSPEYNFNMNILGAILVKLNKRTSVQYAESWNNLLFGMKTILSKPVLNAYRNPDTGNAYMVDVGDVYQVWGKTEKVDGGAKVYRIIGSENDTKFRDCYFHVEDVVEL